MASENDNKQLLFLHEPKTEIYILTCVFILGYFIWSMNLSAICCATCFSSELAPFPGHHMTSGFISLVLLPLIAGEKDGGFTFPDKDLSIGAVVQNKAVVANQQILPKRALVWDLGYRHGTCGIRHLWDPGLQVNAVIELRLVWKSMQSMIIEEMQIYLVQRSRVGGVRFTVILWRAFWKLWHLSQDLSSEKDTI